MSLTLSKEVLSPITYQPNTTGALRTDGPFVLGGDISVTESVRLKSVGWARALPAMGRRQVGVWSQTGTLIGASLITGIGPGIFPSPITLNPGFTYRVGVLVATAEAPIEFSDLAVIQPAPSPIVVGTPYFTSSATLVRPTTAGTNGQWYGDHIFNFDRVSTETKIEPPEPNIVKAPGSFSITLPSEWMPSDLREWDLQYQTATDNANFSEWKDLGTFATMQLPDEPEDPDTEPEISGSYTHSGLPTFPRYFYRYRYRIRNAISESEWSEAAIAGLAELDLSIAPGSITGEHIANGAISGLHIANGVISALHISAGTITGDRIAAGTITAVNIQSNTITALQIAAGTITAVQIAAGTIIAGNIAAGTITGDKIAANTITGDKLISDTITAREINVPDLSAVAATMGTVTGGIFQTQTSGARMMLGTSIATSTGTKNGLVAVDASNNITMIADAATGDVSLKGELKQGSTGLGNIDGVTQNAVLMVGGGNVLTPAMTEPTAAGVTEWQSNFATISRDTTTYLVPPASVRYTAAAGFNNLTVPTIKFERANPGEKWSSSMYVYSTTAQLINFGVWYVDDVYTDLGVQLLAFTTLPNQWKKVTFNGATAPAGTTRVFLYMNGTFSAGQVLYLSSPILVKAAVAMGSSIIADSITATEIAAGTITAVEIAANAITAGKIAANAVTAGTIDAGAVTAQTISANAIDGKIITGATIQTSHNHPKFLFNSATGVQATSAVGSVTSQMTQSGLDIIAESVSSNSAWDKIKWHYGSIAGPVTTDLYGWHSGTQRGGSLRAYSPSSTHVSTLGVSAVDALTQFTSVSASAGLINSQVGATIIDSVGRSSFMRKIHAVVQFFSGTGLAIQGSYGNYFAFSFTTPVDSTLGGIILGQTQCQNTTGTWHYVLGKIDCAQATFKVNPYDLRIGHFDGGSAARYMNPSPWCYVHLPANTACTFNFQLAASSTAVQQESGANMAAMCGLFWKLDELGRTP